MDSRVREKDGRLRGMLKHAHLALIALRVEYVGPFWEFTAAQHLFYGQPLHVPFDGAWQGARWDEPNVACEHGGVLRLERVGRIDGGAQRGTRGCVGGLRGRTVGGLAKLEDEDGPRHACAAEGGTSIGEKATALRHDGLLGDQRVGHLARRVHQQVVRATEVAQPRAR